MTSVSARLALVARPLLRFLRTPKGLTLVVFVGLLALSLFKVDIQVVTSNVILAAAVAAPIDLALSYVRRRRWTLPDGAILTGIIIAFILRPQEGWIVVSVTVALAIASKHALRTRWSNVLNPAALALVVAALALNTGQSWWGALPDLGLTGAAIVLVVGALIANRINKLPMILAFFAAYFSLFTLATLFRSDSVAEVFVTPDLQAVIFFAFFMLDDPPTSPVRYEDQVVFGIIVATVSYFVFMQFGGVYFLPAGLLAGNAWESARRLLVGRMRVRGASPLTRQQMRLRAGGLATASLALPLVFATGIMAANGTTAVREPDATAATAPSSVTVAPTASIPSSRVAPTPDPYPFLPSFDADFSGNYTQTSDTSGAHLLMNGQTTGEFAFGLHVELAQVSVVPTPDDESVEATPDDEAIEARPQVTTTVNVAQILDPTSKALLCDGKLTGLSAGAMRLSCDGRAAYIGVRMQLGGQLDAAPDGSVNGSLAGTMQRMS